MVGGVGRRSTWPSLRERAVRMVREVRAGVGGGAPHRQQLGIGVESLRRE